MCVSLFSLPPQERARLFSVRHTGALTLQCWWRAIAAYRVVEAKKDALVAPRLMEDYLESRYRELQAAGDRDTYQKVQAHYKHEIKQCRTAFFTGTAKQLLGMGAAAIRRTLTPLTTTCLACRQMRIWLLWWPEPVCL